MNYNRDTHYLRDLVKETASEGRNERGLIFSKRFIQMYSSLKKKKTSC